uniref:Uncharacterized protein n=1 Tax=Oryzias latipes TaxID=8090 RepID=A0A3P9HV02_ORYLA
MDQWLRTGSLKRNSDETYDTTVKVLRVDENSSSSVNNAAEVQEDVANVIANSSKETPPQSCETRHQREKSTAKAMKPAKLKRHLETKHKEYQGKPIGFFERKRDELKKHMMKETSQFFAPGENAKATEASYKVSLLIAKAGKPHSIGENLVKPAAKVMANILFGGKAGDEINRIPLSNDTVQRRIKAMAESVEHQLVTRLRQSQFFSLQLDESIDLGNEANLLCFVRYIYAGGLHDEFLFCRSLPTNTTGEAIFHSLNDFIVKNNLDWSRCVGICTDGATAMTGKQKGIVARIRAVAPSAAATHCCIHREQLAVKKMPQCLKSVLDESVKIVNKIKAKPLNSRLFKAVCEEMGSEHTKLLFHTEVRWLSRGKVLTRLFELRDEVMLFLHHSDELYDRMHDFQWLAKLAYLADIFSTLNTLNVALQGKTVTIFNVQDKIKTTRLKMELWCGRLDRREFDSFPTLADFLLASGEDVDGSTVASFKQHLQDLHSQLGIYFPELDASFDWIRNPFGDKTHIEQFTSKLSPREVDSLVDIASDGTLKTTFREKGLTDFWLHIQPEHPQLADSALKLLMPFPTTYNCEVGFSTLVGLKTKQRNRISVDYDMRLKLSSLEPDIKKQHHSSH